MPAASPAPAQAAAPVSAPVNQKVVPVAAQPLAPASKLAPSRYEFEAERVAMERGCRGAGGVRPSARLVAREGHVEVFEMSCAPLRVRCDTGMCRVMD